jgi:hypothetical protein
MQLISFDRFDQLCMLVMPQGVSFYKDSKFDNRTKRRGHCVQLLSMILLRISAKGTLGFKEGSNFEGHKAFPVRWYLCSLLVSPPLFFRDLKSFCSKT